MVSLSSDSFLLLGLKLISKFLAGEARAAGGGEAVGGDGGRLFLISVDVALVCLRTLEIF